MCCVLIVTITRYDSCELMFHPVTDSVSVFAFLSLVLNFFHVTVEIGLLVHFFPSCFDDTLEV